MKLREYYLQLRKFCKENPGLWDAEVVYATDPEGSCFYPVHSTPVKGIYDEDDKTFVCTPDLALPQEELDKKSNAICIN